MEYTRRIILDFLCRKTNLNTQLRTLQQAELTSSTLPFVNYKQRQDYLYILTSCLFGVSYYEQIIKEHFSYIYLMPHQNYKWKAHFKVFNCYSKNAYTQYMKLTSICSLIIISQIMMTQQYGQIIGGVQVEMLNHLCN